MLVSTNEYWHLALVNAFLEILMQRVKNLQPEEIATRIEQFNKELCTETFLGELKNLLPTPEQVRLHQTFSRESKILTFRGRWAS